MRPPSAGTVLGFVALMVALGGTALAATGELVTIADGETASHLAKVDKAGRVHVGDGRGPMTVDGSVSQAPPGAFVRGRVSLGNQTCKPVLTAPAGRGLIVRNARVNVLALGSDTVSYVALWVGAPPCSAETLVEVVDLTGRGAQTLPYEPGLTIPSGKALLAEAQVRHGSNLSVNVAAFGFSVPSSQVPAVDEQPLSEAAMQRTARP